MKWITVLYTALSLAIADPIFLRSILYNKANEAIRNTPRVVYGQAAVLNQFPYQVVVQPPGALCGGSLISNSWVLTAAHCTTASQVTIRIGTISQRDGGISQTSFNIINHPDGHDISLVRLPSPVGFTDAIKPVRLPTSAQIGASFLGFQSTISGWGRIAPDEVEDRNYLRWAFQRVISNAECARYYGSVADNVLCTLGINGKQAVCNGDSGGPLTINEGGVYTTLIGVAIFASSEGCHVGHPSGFSRVTSFNSWIVGVTGIPIRS